jgi:glycosyltransferase involved in cell wall biosynthesis
MSICSKRISAQADPTSAGIHHDSVLDVFGSHRESSTSLVMNILLVTPWRPSLTGGISTVVTRLTGEFQKKGHHITIFVADRENCLRQIESLDITPVYGMYLRSPVSSHFPIRGLVMCGAWFPLTMLQLIWLARRKRLDAIIIQYPLAGMFYFGILKRLIGCVLLVTYQGNDAHDLSLWDRREQRLVRFLLEKADVVLAVSRTLLRKVQDVFPDLHLARTVLLPNGAPLDSILDNEQYQKDAGLSPDFVLTVGHLIHRKGIDVVIAALSAARDRGVRLHLVIAGEGPERENLMQQSREHGISDQVCFLGNQSHRQILSLMKSCLLFVLASRAEGMPLVIAEAMACGRAVVATNVDGIPEIVQDGTTGLLVPAEDPASLASALIKLYSDRGFRDALAEKGKEWAFREYNWAGIANRYLGIIEECQAP